MRDLDFTQVADAIKIMLASGDVNSARDALDVAWEKAGDCKPKRIVAHGLGNDIQKVIFHQFALEQGYNLEA